MTKATLCGKWEIPIHFDLDTTEEDQKLHSRSYIHYVTSHLDFVSAKCWATEWVLSDVVEEGLSLCEYYAGVGIQTTIASHILKPNSVLLLEQSEECATHLERLGYEVVRGDSNREIPKYEDFQVKFADLPSSSALKNTREWGGNFRSLFSNSPELVLWTDTARSRPISIHGHRYASALGVESLSSWDEYTIRYSEFIHREFGYSIVKAAVRGRNATYYAAVPGKHDPDIKHFPLKEYTNGFLIHD